MVSHYTQFIQHQTKLGQHSRQSSKINHLTFLERNPYSPVLLYSGRAHLLAKHQKTGVSVGMLLLCTNSMEEHIADRQPITAVQLTVEVDMVEFGLSSHKISDINQFRMRFRIGARSDWRSRISP
jgi:hypothetical protein